jgi:predicted PhzF superfamily epimerase YddE/YHI9
VGRNRSDLLVELASESEVRELQPDLQQLRRVPARGIIVTARAENGDYHFVSRFFGPAVGVDEDPVTGSAHCCLGPYWAERLRLPEVVGYQASARGGVVRVRPRGDRVVLAGQAVTVMRGELVEP